MSNIPQNQQNQKNQYSSTGTSAPKSESNKTGRKDENASTTGGSSMKDEGGNCSSDKTSDCK